MGQIHCSGANLNTYPLIIITYGFEAEGPIGNFRFGISTKREFILFSVCPVSFEKHGYGDRNQTGDYSKVILEEKLMMDDVGGKTESWLSNFTCECAKIAKNQQNLSLAIGAEYLTVINGWYINILIMITTGHLNFLANCVQSPTLEAFTFIKCPAGNC